MLFPPFNSQKRTAAAKGARNFNLDLSDGNGVVVESIKPFSKRHHLLPSLSFKSASFMYAGGHPYAARSKLTNFSRGAAELKKVEASLGFEVFVKGRMNLVL